MLKLDTCLRYEATDTIIIIIMQTKDARWWTCALGKIYSNYVAIPTLKSMIHNIMVLLRAMMLIHIVLRSDSSGSSKRDSLFLDSDK